MLSTFFPGLTISLNFTYQKLCRCLILGGFGGQICWMGYWIGSNRDASPGSIPYHYNTFSISLCLPVILFTFNNFYQGTHNPLIGQYWWPDKSIVSICLISQGLILLFSFCYSSNSWCYFEPAIYFYISLY